MRPSLAVETRDRRPADETVSNPDYTGVRGASPLEPTPATLPPKDP